MSIKAISEAFGLSWGRVKKVEKDQLAKDCAHIPHETERGHLDEMRGTFSELSDVHGMKEQLRGIYTFAEYETGARWLLEDWCETARMTAVHELVTMAQTITDHMEGILGYWRYGKACNSGAEGFNTKIRWLIKQAFGYRDREYLKLKIYALPNTEINRSL